jgi:hypothetical protein
VAASQNGSFVVASDAIHHKHLAVPCCNGAVTRFTIHNRER